MYQRPEQAWFERLQAVHGLACRQAHASQLFSLLWAKQLAIFANTAEQVRAWRPPMQWVDSMLVGRPAQCLVQIDALVDHESRRRADPLRLIRRFAPSFQNRSWVGGGASVGAITVPLPPKVFPETNLIPLAA